MKKYATNLPTKQPYNAGRTSQTELTNKYTKKTKYFFSEKIIFRKKLAALWGHHACLRFAGRTSHFFKRKKKKKANQQTEAKSHAVVATRQLPLVQYLVSALSRLQTVQWRPSLALRLHD